MPLDPLELIHLVDIEDRRDAQNPETGAMEEKWKPFATNVFAKITPVSVREFIASNQKQGEVTARIVIGFRDGLTASMRIVGKSRPYAGRLFNVHGWLNDPETGVNYVTAPCSEGPSAGS